MESESLLSLIELALGIAKDKAVEDSLLRVQNAQREYLLVQAETGRKKSRAIICAMAKLDQSIRMFEHEYEKIKPSLSREAREPFEKLYSGLGKKREELRRAKRAAGVLTPPDKAKDRGKGNR